MVLCYSNRKVTNTAFKTQCVSEQVAMDNENVFIRNQTEKKLSNSGKLCISIWAIMATSQCYLSS